ncbi:MAG: BrnT family toxin [Bryobacteraceae bacterium]
MSRATTSPPQQAEQALSNEPIDFDYDVVEGEQRWTIIGHTNDLRVLLVVWTLRGDMVRVVTAREASMRARNSYPREKGFPV